MGFVKLGRTVKIEIERENRGEPVPVAPARKEYSGPFNVRIDRRVHRALAIEAAKAGVSLNTIVSQKLARSTLQQ